MNIRPAQPGDLPALLEIFAHARAFMAQTGNPTQWPATYPGAELMQQQMCIRDRCKTKHLTNTRASGSDDALRLIPVTKFSLEGCLEFLAPDELLEVTPENLRIRKRILDHDLRMKATSKKSKG